MFLSLAAKINGREVAALIAPSQPDSSIPVNLWLKVQPGAENTTKLGMMITSVVLSLQIGVAPPFLTTFKLGPLSPNGPTLGLDILATVNMICNFGEGRVETAGLTAPLHVVPTTYAFPVVASITGRPTSWRHPISPWKPPQDCKTITFYEPPDTTLSDSTPPTTKVDKPQTSPDQPGEAEEKARERSPYDTATHNSPPAEASAPAVKFIPAGYEPTSYWAKTNFHPPQPGTAGRYRRRRLPKCFKCGQRGHFSDRCGNDSTAVPEATTAHPTSSGAPRGLTSSSDLTLQLQVLGSATAVARKASADNIPEKEPIDHLFRPLRVTVVERLLQSKHRNMVETNVTRSGQNE